MKSPALPSHTSQPSHPTQGQSDHHVKPDALNILYPDKENLGLEHTKLMSLFSFFIFLSWKEVHEAALENLHFRKGKLGPNGQRAGMDILAQAHSSLEVIQTKRSQNPVQSHF